MKYGNDRILEIQQETLGRPLWRTRFGRVYGLVVRETTQWMCMTESSKIWYGVATNTCEGKSKCMWHSCGKRLCGIYRTLVLL